MEVYINNECGQTDATAWTRSKGAFTWFALTGSFSHILGADIAAKWMIIEGLMSEIVLRTADESVRSSETLYWSGIQNGTLLLYCP